MRDPPRTIDPRSHRARYPRHRVVLARIRVLLDSRNQRRCGRVRFGNHRTRRPHGAAGSRGLRTWLKPDRRSKAVLVHDRAGRRPEEALVPLDAPPEVGHGQGVMAERRKRGHSLTLGIPDSHARIRRLGTPKCWRLRFARFCPAISHRPAGRSDSFAYTVRLREHRRTPGGVDVSDALTMWREVAAGFDRRLANVGVDEWTAPTCCPEWTVSQLVEHAIGSQRFVPKALGASGDIDAEGDDLVEVWKTVRAAADQAFAAPGAMDRVVTLPFGEMPAREGLGFPTGDLLVHTWDLARSIGADDRLDAEACTVTYANLAPIDGHIRAPDSSARNWNQLLMPMHRTGFSPSSVDRSDHPSACRTAASGALTRGSSLSHPRRSGASARPGIRGRGSGGARRTPQSHDGVQLLGHRLDTGRSPT